jgi:hypothetical protein
MKSRDVIAALVADKWTKWLAKVATLRSNTLPKRAV